MSKVFSGLLTAPGVGVALFAATPEVEAQTTFTAGRVPTVGAIYMVGIAGAPSACLDPSHVEFSWTEGGATLSAGSVQTTHIADGAVTPAKIATQSITSAQIADSTIGAHDLVADIVESTTILDGSIATVDLADGAVTQAKLDPGLTVGVSAGSIGTVELADAAVTALKLADDAVTSAKIADGTIIAADLVGGTITGAEIGDGAVGTTELVDLGVATIDIADGAVTSAKIAVDAVTGAGIAPDAVGSTEILDLSILTADIQDGAVTSAKIATGAVGQNELAVDLPVAVSADLGSSGTLTGTNSIVGSVIVNAPSAGSVFVIASGEAQIAGHVELSYSSVRVGVSTDASTFGSAESTRFFVSGPVPNGSFEVPFAVHGLFPVTPGANTFYLLAREDGLSGTGALYLTRLTATFIGS